MTSTTTNNFNKALKFAVEQNNMELLKWVLGNKDLPDNLNECLLLAIEKQQNAMVEILISKIAPIKELKEPKEPKKVEPRPLTVLDGIKIDMSKITKNVDKNSQFMFTLKAAPDIALQQLEDGIISKEEINHQNGGGWTALMYVSRNANLIEKSEKIIKKLLELEADVNIQDKDGYTALHLASRSISDDSNEKTVEILFNHPKINLQLKNIHDACALEQLFVGYREDQWDFVNNLIKDKAKHNGCLLSSLAKRNMKHAEQLLSEKRITFQWPEDCAAFDYLSKAERTELSALIKKYA